MEVEGEAFFGCDTFEYNYETIFGRPQATCADFHHYTYNCYRTTMIKKEKNSEIFILRISEPKRIETFDWKI